MGDVDPEMLLEWLEMGHGDVRDMQLIALEQLCMLLLMSDNIDQCFESCPPRTFLPALCNIFMDESAPENILEVTARAMTFYLDVSPECTRRIVSVDGAVKALCDRLTVKTETRTGKDLAEQCIKVLEFMVTREAGMIFQAGGLPAVLYFISELQATIHKDTLHSAMAVVSKLCTKCEPTDETLPHCVLTLSHLLHHPDSQVSDGALRCFASLSDRFTRKNIDPAPLGEHGLVEELLDRLTSAIPNSYSSTPVRGNTRPQSMSANNQAPSEGTVSMVISLLSALCRGSESITTTLLQSNLSDAISAALSANERCVLDTMRLIDLLLLLMFEGRRALPRTAQPTVTTSNMSNDSANHKQLIDCIRSKDSNALMELIENGNYDVNFMDDVGQTLLNWASAFGTLSMVEYLAKKGADVNRGQRSSSLHYAACFGRPAIAKALLSKGANPDLRDEDGKTPLDKAREKNDEGHREVVHILQNPGEWMVEQQVTETAKPAAAAAAAAEEEAVEEKKQEEKEEETPVWVRDDEMIIKYLRYWIPQFTHTFHSTLYTSVRKSSLTLLRKIVRYMTPSILQQLCEGEAPYSAQIVETIASVLEVSNEEGTVPALVMVRDLCERGSDIFMDHFCRLGVINHISKKAKVYLEEKQQSEKDIQYLEDATEIHPYRPYHWCQWSVLHAKDCIYIWCDYAAIALSGRSNGWFSFILDGKLSTIYSDGGSLDSNNSDSAEPRCEFLEKLQRAKSQVTIDKPSQPVLSVPGHRITIDNWCFYCRREGEIVIDNAEGQQNTILREDLPGFIFESNKGTTHSFTAESTLGSEFAVGWGKKTCKVKTKSKQIQMQINTLSEEIYEKYFADKINHMRPVVAKMKGILEDIDSAVTLHNDGKPISHWRGLLKDSFTQLAHILHNDSSLSTFELNACQLVPCLLRALGNELKQGNCSVKQLNAINTSLLKSQERLEVFKEAFVASYTGTNGDTVLLADTLVKKLVSVMESVENLPLYLYESPGAMYGLQVLTKRLRFRLERYAGEHTLLDRSGRTLKIEPMTAVSTVEDYLRKNVAKQWYDYDRSTFKYIRDTQEAGSIQFKYNTDFDEGGIVYWIGSNGRSTKEWKNPSVIKVIMVSSSDGRNLPYGSLDDVLSRESAAKNVHTSDDKNGWISIDLALWVIPTRYSLRHSRGFGRSALRNWLFQCSKDSKAWVTLRSHVDDTTLNEPGSTATWTVEPPADEKQGWRHFRIHLNGKNSSGQTHYLSLSGFELYGTVTGVCDDPPMEIQPTKTHLGTDRALKRLNRDPDTLLCRQRLRFYRRQVIKNLSSRPSRVDWKSLQSDTESIKSCSSTGGEAIPGTPDSTEAVGGSETLSVGTISSTPDVTTVDELDDTVSSTSRQESLTTPFNQRNLATDLESFVLELAQAVMDTNDTDRNTVCTINELLGAMPQRTGRGTSGSLFSTDSISRPGPSTANTVEQNNDLNSQKSTSANNIPEIYNFEEEFSDITEPVTAGSKTNSASLDRELSISEIDILPAEESSREEERRTTSRTNSTTSRTNSSSDYLTPDTTSETTDDIATDQADVSVAEVSNVDITEPSNTPDNTLDKTPDNTPDSATPPSDYIPLFSTESPSGTEQVSPLPSTSHLPPVPSTSSEQTPPVPSSSSSTAQIQASTSGTGTATSGTGTSTSGTVTSTTGSEQGASTSDQTLSFLENIPPSDMLGILGPSTSMKKLLDTMKETRLENPGSVPGSDISECTFDSQESDLPTALEPFIDLSKFEIPGQNLIGGSSRKHPAPEESPSTPTNDLSSGGIGVSSSNDTILGENISETPVKTPPRPPTFSTLPPWHKSLFSQATSQGIRNADYMRFDDADLENQEEMEIEEEDCDDEDEDEDMGFEIDIESESETDTEHKPLRKRIWDDDVVLKRQFSALIPAFDPRPGRSNVAQTTDIEVPVPGPGNTPESVKRVKESSKKPRLALFIRGPALPGNKPDEYLCPPQKTIYSCIITMCSLSKGGYLPTNTVRRLWEPTYTLVYREVRPSDSTRLLNQDIDMFETTPFKPRWELDYVRKYLGTEKLSKLDLINYIQSYADSLWLKKWRLTGSPKSLKKSKSCSNLSNAYKDFIQHLTGSKQSDSDKVWYKEFSQCLMLLSIMYNTLVKERQLEGVDLDTVQSDTFYSGRLTNRLMQQVQEPLMLATTSIPSWCEKVVHHFPMLIPFDTRSVFFNATAFGISRSIHWLQNIRDTGEQRPRTVRRQDDVGEFRIGRLKHERCTIPRGEEFLDWAFNVLHCHAVNKSVLEIEFRGEEGTGIGPTLEFYSLVAAELQRKDLGLWICDDELPESDEVDLGQGPKAPGYYVKIGPHGLFPAPYPQDSPALDKICSLFHMLGMFLGKSLQDQRLVDLPLSIPFFKMMCQGADSHVEMPLSEECTEQEDLYDTSLIKSASLSSLTESESRYSDGGGSDISSVQGGSSTLETSTETGDNPRKLGALTIEDAAHSEQIVDSSSESSLLTKSSWFAGILNSTDFSMSNPYLSKFLDSLEVLVEEKRAILADTTLTDADKHAKLEALTLPDNSARLQDLCLDFQYTPPSAVYGYSTYDLKINGDAIPLTIRNVEEYIDLVRSFSLDVGIRKQMEAFKSGFNEVFSMSYLRMFSPSEVSLQLCGEMTPNWTREDLLNYTQPKFGYNKDSASFLHLIDILVEMKGAQRKNFLQFATGCSSLPPGGLANLHPRLTVVKKEGDGDTTLPSVNTCVHYLKLPEYSSKEVMRVKLLQSTEEKGFHLN